MGLGATLEWWQRLIPILTPRYRTIIMTTAASAAATCRPGRTRFRQMAEDAAAVMDAAGVESAHVFGASMGGMIAQELALAPPLARPLADPRLHGVRRARMSLPASREVARALGARTTMTARTGAVD